MAIKDNEGNVRQFGIILKCYDWAELIWDNHEQSWEGKPFGTIVNNLKRYV